MNPLEKIPRTAASSNIIFFNIENEKKKIQIQSQTNFLVVDPTKN